MKSSRLTLFLCEKIVSAFLSLFLKGNFLHDIHELCSVFGISLSDVYALLPSKLKSLSNIDY